MNIFILLAIVVLMIIIITLIIKIIIMNKSLKDIEHQIIKKISGTNNLITISTRNKNINYLANELNKNLKRLHEKELQYNNGNRELYKSITNISHDLRTPLTAIKGYINLLKEEKDEQKVKKYRKILEKKTEELIQLTEQLFDYTRSFDLNRFHFEKICINDILEDVIVSYYDLLKEKKINIVVHICSEKIYKMIDRTLMIRILENILSNALKYADSKISITLSENGELLFLNQTNALDKVSVNKIFDRYFTVENGSKSTGVGLSIAKQLVELMNGTIEADYQNSCLIIKILL